MPEPDVYIYLDEFERDDTFLLGAALVHADVASLLLSEWDELRQRIKAKLMSEYPNAKRNPLLQGHKLPELHAVNLFQSIGYYRKYAKGENPNEKYWEQHYEWLEEALAIAQKYKVQFLCSGWKPNFFEENIRPSAYNYLDTIFLSAQEKLGLDLKYSSSKLKQLASNKYFYALPLILSTIEGYLRSQNQFGEIICDDHEMSKGFSVFDSFEWLKAQRRYEYLTKPVTASSLDESLIQVCDVLSYVAGQYVYARDRDIPLKPPLKKWYEEYIAPLYLTTEKRLGDYIDINNVHVLTLEFALETCVSPSYQKSQFKMILRGVFEKLE